MLHKNGLCYYLALLCCLVAIKVQGQPVPGFTYSSGTLCAGQVVNFTSTSTGANPPFRYSWDFGGQGSSTLTNPSHAFTTIPGCGTQNFNVTLVVTDALSNSSSISRIVTVGQLPNLEFTDTKHRFDAFTSCNFFGTTFTVGLALLNAPPASCEGQIDRYEIDWGDGTAIQTVPSIPVASGDNGIPHNYTNYGIYTLTITVFGDNGCTSTYEREVVHMTNPGGAIYIPPGMMGLCAPADTLQFAILDWGCNLPGTSYTVSFGDGTIIHLRQEDMWRETGTTYCPCPPSSS